MKTDRNCQETLLDINSLREQIDRLDERLLEIFNQRAALALEIGAIKKQQDLPIYDPARESLIFERVKNTNPGPLDDGAIVRLFERVIDESRRLERIRAQGE
jgi:chorismate mutase